MGVLYKNCGRGPSKKRGPIHFPMANPWDVVRNQSSWLPVGFRRLIVALAFRFLLRSGLVVLFLAPVALQLLLLGTCDFEFLAGERPWDKIGWTDHLDNHAVAAIRVTLRWRGRRRTHRGFSKIARRIRWRARISPFAKRLIS